MLVLLLNFGRILCSDLSRHENTQQDKHKLTIEEERIVQNRLDTNSKKKEDDLSRGLVGLVVVCLTLHSSVESCPASRSCPCS